MARRAAARGGGGGPSRARPRCRGGSARCSSAEPAPPLADVTKTYYNALLTVMHSHTSKQLNKV